MDSAESAFLPPLAGETHGNICRCHTGTAGYHHREIAQTTAQTAALVGILSTFAARLIARLNAIRIAMMQIRNDRRLEDLSATRKSR